jgi:hypothetical protein
MRIGPTLGTNHEQFKIWSYSPLRLLPPSVQPPEIINFSASSVPILQLGLSGKGLAAQQLNDLALKQRQVMINMDHNLMQAGNVSPTEVLQCGERSEPHTSLGNG